MGCSFSAATVPFSVKDTFVGYVHDAPPEGTQKVITELHHDYKGNTVLDINGWSFNSSEVVQYKELFCFILRKETKIVYSVNESNYSIAGEIESSFFSTNKEDLAEFMKDQSLVGNILENSAVKQTL